MVWSNGTDNSLYIYDDDVLWDGKYALGWYVSIQLCSMHYADTLILLLNHIENKNCKLHL